MTRPILKGSGSKSIKKPTKLGKLRGSFGLAKKAAKNVAKVSAML